MVGRQAWQALVGLGVFPVTMALLMKQSAEQLPELSQMVPVPQEAPTARAVKAELDFAGSHCWQALLGLASPEVKIFAPMKQTLLQTPPEHSSPPPHAVPSATLLKLLVEVPGWQLWQALLESPASAS